MSVKSTAAITVEVKPGRKVRRDVLTVPHSG